MNSKFHCHQSISTKFNLYLIAAGVLVTILALSLNLALHYRQIVEKQLVNVETAANMRLPKLANALWNIDPLSIRQELDGFTELPGVSWVELTTSLGRAQARGKTNPGKGVHEDKSLTLDIYPPENRTLLGTLTLHIKSQPIMEGYLDEVWISVGTLLLQLALFLTLGNLLLHRLILVRVRQQTSALLGVHLESLDVPAPDEANRTADELDQLAMTFNQTRRRLAEELQTHNEATKHTLEEQLRLEGEVARRAGEAVYLNGFLKQLSRLSSDFLILPCERMDTALRDALHEISVFLGLDTCFVISIGTENEAEIRSFWRRDTLSIAPLEVFLRHEREDYAASFTLLHKEKLVQLNASQLPANGLESRLAELLQLQSLALVRLESPEQTIGLLCGGMTESTHQLSDMERRLLGMTGNIVANLLLHRQENIRIKKIEAEAAILRERLAALTQNDPLTGLSNAETFRSTLDSELRRAHRTGAAIALILLEIDQFAELCQQKGHEAGNEALRIVAQEITRLAARSGDLAAHLDDHQFALLLPDTAADGALTIAQHLLGSIAVRHLSHCDQHIHASMALLRHSHCTHSDAALLMHQAKQTLDQAQQNGGNRIEIFDAINQ